MTFLRRVDDIYLIDSSVNIMFSETREIDSAFFPPTEEDFDKVLSINVKGVYNCLQAGVKHMRANGGSIVNIASTAPAAPSK